MQDTNCDKKSNATMIDDESFRSGHDNFIYILRQNFHLASVRFSMNISSGATDINISAWNKSYNEMDKRLEADLQYINFRLSPELFSFPLEEREKLIFLFVRLT